MRGPPCYPPSRRASAFPARVVGAGRYDPGQHHARPWGDTLRYTRTAIAAVLLLPLAACATNEPAGSSGRATNATVTPAVEEPTEDPAGDEGDDGPFGLTDTVAYENDVEVSLSKFTRGTSSAYASPEKTPYVKFTVKVVNGSKKTVDTTSMMVSCSYGEDGQSSDSIFDEGLDGSPTTKLLAGRSINVPWGCELPEGERVLQVEVSPDFESEAAIFTGNVK